MSSTRLGPQPGHALVLGKFAPLHAGHQLVIERALNECGAVTVVIYDAPSTTAVPLSVRASWIRELYPEVRVIEGWAGPEDVGDSPEIQSMHDAYLANDLSLSGITHVFGSEQYVVPTARGLGASPRIVDEHRREFRVSGTAVRADPWRHRHVVDPIVYRDLVANVVFLGAPSSGKTTLARALAEALETAWMPEYGREYWHRYQRDRRLTPEQLIELAEGHLEREDAALLEANRVLLTDTSALTTWRYGMNYHGHVLPRLEHLALISQARYDLTVLCAPDFPFDDTWDRSGDGERITMHRQIEADLVTRRIPFVTARGTLEERVAQLVPLLRSMTPFDQKWNWGAIT